MKTGLIVLGTVIAALAGPGASAQPILNLSGQFRCVQGCVGPGPAYVTQNGWDLNLVNEVVLLPEWNKTSPAASFRSLAAA